MGRAGAAVLLLLAAPASGAGAQTGPVPLSGSIPPSTRSAGLGGASVALIGYAGSVFTNPAGLAPVRILSLEGGAARVDSGSTYFAGAAAVRAGRLNLGGGIRYLRFDATEPFDNKIETAAAVTLRAAGIALGAGGTYHSVRDAGGGLSRTLTAATAVTVAFFDIAALALSARNLGEWSLGGTTLDLPTRLAVGFSLNLVDTFSNWRLLAAIERTWLDGDGQTLFGLEGGAVLYGAGVVARVGLRGRAADDPYTPGTLGGSLVLGRAAIDYAYLERRSQPPLHLFGLRWTP